MHQLPPPDSPPPLPPDYSPPPIETPDSANGGGIGPIATMVPDTSSPYPDPYAREADPLSTPVNPNSGNAFSLSSNPRVWSMDSFDSDDGSMV